MYTLVVERKYDSRKRFFALCESCYWTATILSTAGRYECPLCNSKEIALIPLSQNEKYEYDWNTKYGLQIRFSLLDKAR
jgi:predicted RNA-binding Zn-ribbon protein involved in translation (DUF1610 family)